MEDIHGIRPPVSVGFDPALLKIILIVSGVVLLLILLFFLIKKLWKKKPTDDLKYLPEPEPPFEAAIKQLDLLFQNPLPDPRLFYFDLTAVFKNYIGRSFNINAVEMTSQEFIKNLNLFDIDSEIKNSISKFLNLSDSFKYAGINPLKEQADKDLLFIKENITKIEKILIKQREKLRETREEGK
ncbi:MAG: hypothetical protein PF690_16975 [Deltaproteobacteria bacterium]|jgi:hypothetical protein|nr:hypothetical protein [Deltaproteobacteria bacterium]